jgi:hypothetical protein
METYDDLGAVIGTVEVDHEALIARAVAAGRRRQRRRRLGAGAGLLAVGAVALGASLHSTTPSVAQDTGVADQPTATPTGAPSDTSVDTSGGPLDVPSSTLTDARLTARLPVPGNLVSASDFPRTAVVTRALDPDGSGTGTVMVALSAEPPLSRSDISAAGDKCRTVAGLDGPESCREIPGGWLFTFRGRPDLENVSPKALDWSATANFENGTSVQVHATNYVGHGDPTRQTPVLTMDQIKALVTDGVWFQPGS